MVASDMDLHTQILSDFGLRLRHNGGKHNGRKKEERPTISSGAFCLTLRREGSCVGIA